MKRISRNPQKFELLRIVDTYARRRELDIRDGLNHELLLGELGRSLEENRNNDILIYGTRVAMMFAYVAAVLGMCRLIKEEDAGELFTDLEIQVPDFRIVTSESHEILVEVKNFHSRDSLFEYKILRSYLDGLKLYASLFGCELFVAIFWSRPKIWTLVAPSDFDVRGDECVISLIDALKSNQMSMLGDWTIGTVPSLSLRIKTDPSKPRKIDSEGQVKVTIEGMELYCGDTLLEDSTEQQIAWFLMNYGDWPGEEIEPEIIAGELISFGFRVAPAERANPHQRFEIVGSLSQMISREFNAMTAPDGKVKLVSPASDPDTLGVVIPSKYKGNALPIWRFLIEPASKAPSKGEAI